MAITVKAVVESEGGKQPEIRRFPLGEIEAGNFALLREKLGKVLDKSFDNGFVVLWKDDEGDDIVVSSNEELQEALAAVKKGTLKLYIRKQQTKGTGSEEEPSTGQQQHPWENLHGFNDIFGLLQNVLRVPPTHSGQQERGSGCAEGEGSSTGQHQQPYGLNDFFGVLQSVLGGLPGHTDTENQQAGSTDNGATSTGQQGADLNDMFKKFWTELGRDSSHCASHNEGASTSNSETRPQNAEGNPSPAPGDFWNAIRETITHNLGASRRSKIEEATNLMMSMGFGNEQEWLSKLLEQTHGNVDQVLDIINNLKQYAGGDLASIPQIVVSLFEAHATNPHHVLSILQTVNSSVPQKA